LHVAKPATAQGEGGAQGHQRHEREIHHPFHAQRHDGVGPTDADGAEADEPRGLATQARRGDGRCRIAHGVHGHGLRQARPRPGAQQQPESHCP
jgi:hypothetical protein